MVRVEGPWGRGRVVIWEVMRRGGPRRSFESMVVVVWCFWGMLVVGLVLLEVWMVVERRDWWI